MKGLELSALYCGSGFSNWGPTVHSGEVSEDTFTLDPEFSMPVEYLFLGSAFPDPSWDTVLLGAASHYSHFSLLSNRRPERLNAEEGEAEEASFSAQGCPSLLGNSCCHLVVFIGLILVSVGTGMARTASSKADPHHPTELPAFPHLPISQSYPGGHNAVVSLLYFTS